MQLHAIPAFVDNYVWVIVVDGAALVVDPGDAAPVLALLESRALALDAILITHHHPDHVGGIQALRARHPAPVYGPAAEAAGIPALQHPLADGDVVERLGLRFEVLEVPGHTRGHIAYHAPAAGGDGLLLCGDTLFSAGCGRLFEGSAEQLHASLQRLAALPPATRVCCTHEYTLANLAFAAAVEPDNAEIAAHREQVRRWRAEDRPSLPSTLALESRINPFLRTGSPAVRAAAAAQAGRPLDSDGAVFAALRRWKDGFRAV